MIRSMWGRHWAKVAATAWVCASALAGACSREEARGGRSAASSLERTYRTGDAQTGELLVVMKVDRQTITPADRVTVTIDATGRDGGNVELPPLEQRLGDFIVASESQEPAATVTPASHRRAVVVLEPFLSGKKKIPGLTVSAKGPGRAAVISIATEPVDLDVRSVVNAGDPDAVLAPAKPPVSLGEDSWPNAKRPVALAAGGVVVVGVVVVWAGVASRQKRRLLLDAGRIAIGEIEEIAGRLDDPAAPAQDTRAVCAELAAALRRFVQRRFGVPATAWSAEQLRREAWKSTAGTGEAEKKDVCDLLTELDVTRFAPSGPERPNVRLMLERARGWVARVEGGTHGQVAAAEGQVEAAA